MIADMRSAHLGPTQLVSCDGGGPQIPDDILYAIAPGADTGRMEPNTLTSVTGCGEARERVHKAFMQAGDWCVVCGKTDRLPVVLGVMMGLVEANGEEQALLFGCSRVVSYFA